MWDVVQDWTCFTGRPFNTARPVNYATSNIISSIVYGSRFEYSDPRFIDMVRRANDTIRIVGSASVQVNLCLLVPMMIRKYQMYNKYQTLLMLLFNPVASQIYNMFPRLASWIKNRQLIIKYVQQSCNNISDLVKPLKETLNPQICRGFIDRFLIRKQKDEVRDS